MVSDGQWPISRKNFSDDASPDYSGQSLDDFVRCQKETHSSFRLPAG